MYWLRSDEGASIQMSLKSLTGKPSNLTGELVLHRVSMPAKSGEIYRYSIGALEGQVFGGEVKKLAFVYGMSNEGRRELIQTLVDEFKNESTVLVDLTSNNMDPTE